MKFYTVRSESKDGTYYLVKNWYKNKKLWVTFPELKKPYLFSRPQDAKASFTTLLKAMPECAEDVITIAEIEL